MQDNTLRALLKHDRMVPRYTSYPTVPHFTAEVPSGWFEDRLAALAPGSSVSVYIHIPFCPRLCWFCGCNTSIVSKYDAVASYVETLRAEIGRTGQAVAAKKLRLGHVHFGGGSPTMVKEEDFAGIMGDLHRHFAVDDDAEIAVEIDPRHMDARKAALYAACGVNRASFGMQDFDPAVMAAVNRPQSFARDREALAQCRAAGIDRVNIDLMYGLPHQTAPGMADCARKALALRPDRVALFGYAHVPWMKKHMRMIREGTLPDRALRPLLFERAAAVFEDAGYIPVGIDHFAREGDSMVTALRAGRLRRSFQGYTDDDAPVLLGFGASAISRIGDAYKQNCTALPAYRDHVSQGCSPVEKYCVMSDEDRLCAAIIEAMMVNLCVNPRAVARTEFGQERDFAACYAALAPLAADGLVRITPDGTVHALVRQAARLTCAVFDHHLPAQTAGRHVTAL
jgi:oxygen-independent coproporphyrinogen-3 oxidase